MSDYENPKCGYGAGDRPLWSVRDRDAEAIRALLRKAGHREFSDTHGGFAVEGANSSEDGAEPFLVSCADADDAFAADELSAYVEVLRGAGYTVTVDPDDEEILEVRPPAAATETARADVSV